MTRGEAFDIACRTAMQRWPHPGLASWSWARSLKGRSVPWVVTIGDRAGPLVRVLVEDDGTTTVGAVKEVI